MNDFYYLNGGLACPISGPAWRVMIIETCCIKRRFVKIPRSKNKKRQTGGRLREAKIGDLHGLAQWPEILADAGG